MSNKKILQGHNKALESLATIAGIPIEVDPTTIMKKFGYTKMAVDTFTPTANSGGTPDKTPALWAVIDVTHAGTIEDPIPASRGMEYVKGLYYIENNVIYLMNRQGMQDGESVVLQYMPSELVGQYFEIVG